jgi:FixJ family two-component response regulator
LIEVRKVLNDRIQAGDVKAVVFVIDNDASMRAALEDLVGSVDLAVRLFASPQEFLASKRPDVPGCLVLDVRLPGMSGLTFQKELSRVGVDLPVIFLTGHGDITMSVRAMKAGAVDFLSKPFQDQDLLDSIHAAIGRDRERRREAMLLAELRERYATLTVRERQIMTLVAVGLANKQIAGELILSEMTVKVHRGQVMRKMQAGSLPGPVRMADRLAGTCSNLAGDLHQRRSASRLSILRVDPKHEISGYAVPDIEIRRALYTCAVREP